MSADLKTKIVPCQFGGNPDCGSCGCVASMGLAAVAAHKLGGVIPVGAIFKASIRIGQMRASDTRTGRASRSLPAPAQLKNNYEFCLSWNGGEGEKTYPDIIRPELRQLLDLTQRVGNDPLLTQASTGNSSAKLDGVLWIKASGKWMADAIRDDIFIPLDLKGVRECLRQKLDPAERYQGASLETALHAALPHRMVLHVHCVNTIAWAVRSDGPFQLARRLEGLRWQWIPYVASGLPLSEAIESRAFRPPRY